MGGYPKLGQISQPNRTGWLPSLVGGSTPTGPAITLVMSAHSPSPSPLTPLVSVSDVTHYGYSEFDRIKAFAVYAETRSVKTAADAINAPVKTVWNWLSDSNAADDVERIRNALRAGIAWDLTECSILATKAIRDRLLNGDPHVTKDGTIVYAPVKLRDATMAMAVSVDKVSQLAATIVPNAEVNSALDKLADALLAKVQSRSVQSVAAVSAALGLDGLSAEGLMG